MGVNLVNSFLRPLIGNQATPLIQAVSGNPVILLPNWIAYGGCPGINTFDALTARPGAARLAEFTDPGGNPGAYTFSAATLNIYNSTNRVVSLPYDLMSVYTSPGMSKVAAPLAARSLILKNVMGYFGFIGMPPPMSGVPTAEKFAVANAPNPFNPRTSIAYTIGAPGHLTVKVFNVRGQLVRTLLDQKVETSGHVVWDGTDDNGHHLASGVYFREARLGDQVAVGKMMLIK